MATAASVNLGGARTTRIAADLGEDEGSKLRLRLSARVEVGAPIELEPIQSP